MYFVHPLCTPFSLSLISRSDTVNGKSNLRYGAYTVLHRHKVASTLSLPPFPKSLHLKPVLESRFPVGTRNNCNINQCLSSPPSFPLSSSPLLLSPPASPNSLPASLPSHLASTPHQPMTMTPASTRGFRYHLQPIVRYVARLT